MSTPADGFYKALVIDNTGEENIMAVRVLEGRVFTVHPYELFPSACRDFQPLPMAVAAGFWPREIGALCDQLTQRVKRLEEIGDRMAAERNKECGPDWEDSLARMWRLQKGHV